MERFVVAVTGWRDHQDAEFIRYHLDGYCDALAITGPKVVFIRVGCAPGADAITRQWRLERGFEGRTYFAEWDRFGPSAGPKRNREMLEGTRDPFGLANVLLAFPGPAGKYPKQDGGTWGCCKEAFVRDIGILIPGR